MIHVCHVFDATANWEHRRCAEPLVERLPKDQFRQSVVVTTATVRNTIGHMGRGAPVFSCRFGLAASAAPGLRKWIEAHAVHVVHAWGPQAALAASAATRLPLVVTVFDPAQAKGQSKLLRELVRPDGVGVACSSGTVRQRLIEGGLDAERAAIIRPGIDFHLVNKLRRYDLRNELGVSPRDRLVTVPPGSAITNGELDAVFAACLVNHLSGNVRVVVPGASASTRRIERFIRHLPVENVVRFPGHRLTFEQLLACSNVLIVSAEADISTTAIAWAMACRAAVVGSALPAVAELIAHRVNGLLFKRVRGQRCATNIAGLLQDTAALEKMREAAYGQAYEVFGMRRYMEQHARLYRNLLTGFAAGDGIFDPASTH